jgi:hypothetical protein
MEAVGRIPGPDWKQPFSVETHMPDRYHIHTVTTPGRFYRVGKFGGIDWREDCSRCSNCVKRRCCYDVYDHETDHNRDPFAPSQTLNECKACFSCVQGCTKGLLSLSVNPEFLEMGDEFWKPDVILTTWNQADTGKIPVSGAGYRGLFHGPGFDSIWTDMSEIVRPTRDGIHGREYISTSVDIGSKPMRLSFAPDGAMLSAPAKLLEIQLPTVLDIPGWPVQQPALSTARAVAAEELKTVAMMHAEDALLLSTELQPFTAPILHGDLPAGILDKPWAMIQLMDGADILKTAEIIRGKNPAMILSVRMPLGPATTERLLDLFREGFRVFHLCADLHGKELAQGGTPGRHIKDVLRDLHSRLVKEGIRDEVTLVIAGGIALAEHMAKSIICGADLVAADTALMVALGCRVCRDAHVPGQKSCACPAAIDSVDTSYAAQRIVNLMGAWHSQLIEVLGAMGIREARRLRGEMGRAIFMEEIEKEAFGDLYRVRQEQVSA